MSRRGNSENNARQKSPTVELGPLQERYEIVGELHAGGRQSHTTYMARRREDGAEVIITVARSAPDDNNALSHVASDTQLLTDLRHPNMPNVIDGMWLGDSAFAIVSERVRGMSLSQLLERHERLETTRVASVLRVVASVLDWAREHDIVHRRVTSDRVIFGDDSDATFVALLPGPIPLSGMPDACSDARTVGLLARDMLAGEYLDDGESESAESPHSLASVRPELATSVIDATERIAACRQGDTPDVAAYLATVASADVLKQSEVQMAALKDEYDEQHRREIEKCEAQRAELEQKSAEQVALLAGEREEFERLMADEQAKMAEERDRFNAAMTDRQQQLARVEAELEAQRTQVAERFKELDARFRELDAHRAEVNRLRDEAIAAGANLPQMPSTPAPAHPLASAPARAKDFIVRAVTPVGGFAKVKRKEEPAAPSPAIAHPELQLPPIVLEPTPARSRSRLAGWFFPAIVVVVLAALIGTAIAINHTHQPDATAAGDLGESAPPAPSAITSAPATAPLPRGGFLTQTPGGGGSASQPFNGSPVNTGGPPTPADSAMAAAAADSSAAADSAQARAQRHAAALAAARRDEERRARAADSMNSDGLPHEEHYLPDTITKFRDTVVKHDTIGRPDGAPPPPPRPDTTKRH